MSQKRNRSINWDEEEKQLLTSVLKDFVQIIENKSLDTNTSKLKTKAWEDVCKKFNELNSRPRHLNQLKIQWKTMKINARKTFSTFKKEVHKTGGGVRPATPDASVVEIKDLLNPAELLRDHNEHDSDGIIIAELEFPTPSETCHMKQDTCMENIEDVDAKVALQKYTPLVVSQDNTKAVEEMDTLPVTIFEDDIQMTTPIKRSLDILPGKKVRKRKIIVTNNVVGHNGSKPKKDQDDYVNRMVIHSKMLKDEEHMRHMEMAEEEHAIKMDIHKKKLRMAEEEHELKMKIQMEKLKLVIQEREMLEKKHLST